MIGLPDLVYVDCHCMLQVADLETFFSLEAAGVKGLFKEACAFLQELVKQDERERREPAPSSGLISAVVPPICVVVVCFIRFGNRSCLRAIARKGRQGSGTCARGYEDQTRRSGP